MARGASGPTPAADAHLEPGIFPSRLRQLVEDALTGRLAHAARIVIPRTSDADYKCFLYLREFVRRGVTTALAPVVLFDLLQSRGADVPAYDVARTRALLDELASVSGRMPSADDLRGEIARANAARAAARRLVALRRGVPRVTGAEVFPLLARVLGDGAGSLRGAGERRCDEDRGAPAARRPTRAAHRSACGWPRRCTRPSNRTAPSSLPRSARGEAAPPGDDVRIDDDPVAALADKYRADSIGARTPVDALRRWTESMLDDVDAVVVSLPPDDAVFGWDYPALRDVLKARRIPHVCLRGDPYRGANPCGSRSGSTRWCPRPRSCRRRGMADKQLEATVAASAFQKQWFADLRRRVFDERQPYALLQADVPFELFDLLDIPAVSNQWWAAIVAAKRQAPAFLDAMDADGLHGDLCRYCSLGYASTRYPDAGEPPWGGLPTPRLLCARLTCDCIHRVFSLWADAFGAELFEIDHPGAGDLPPRWWELGRHRWRELVEPHRLAFVVVDAGAARRAARSDQRTASRSRCAARAARAGQPAGGDVRRGAPADRRRAGDARCG